MSTSRTDTEWIPSKARVARRQVAAAACFSTAGVLFIVVSFLAGFSFLTAFGVDVQYPSSYTVPVQIASAGIWVAGLVMAVLGLIAWATSRRAGTSGMRWALADLGYMAVATAILLVLIQSQPG